MGELSTKCFQLISTLLRCVNWGKLVQVDNGLSLWGVHIIENAIGLVQHLPGRMRRYTASHIAILLKDISERMKHIVHLH